MGVDMLIGFESYEEMKGPVGESDWETDDITA